MSATYTITVTDALGATATVNVLIDVKLSTSSTLIYDPIYRDNAFSIDASSCFDDIVEFELYISRDGSSFVDTPTDVLLSIDASNFTDNISGGGGGS